MIDWQKHFDRVYVIHYIPYEERLEHLRSELARVGLLDSPVLRWKYTYDTPFQQVLYKDPDIMKPDPKQNPNFHLNAVKVALAHYSVMKECLGQEDVRRILIMENDITFLKDLSLMETVIEELPNYADVVLFDKVVVGKPLYDKYISEGPVRDTEHYYRYLFSVYLASCYAVSRKAMDIITRSQETFLHGPDMYTNVAKWFEKDESTLSLHRMFTVPSLGMQKPFSKQASEHSENGNTVYEAPKIYADIRKEDYNL